MRHIKLYVGILVLLAAFVAFMMGPSVSLAEPSAQGGGDQGVLTSGIQPLSQPVWTKEMMESAIPYPIPSLSGTPKQATAQVAAGATGTVAPGAPGLVGAPKSNTNEPAATSGISLLGYGYPAPFNRMSIFPSTSYNIFPYRTVGKVFFSRLGLNYVCSGSSAGGGRQVWTAGHCLYDNAAKRWDSSFTFVPAYNNGSTPYGSWTWSSAAIPTAYAGGAQGYDMAVVAMNYLGGLKISQRVGWLGLAWNWSVVQMWNSIGYPQAAPFNGAYMWTCQASYAYSDGAFSPNPVGIGCDMTGGCSGGPWIWRMSASGGYLNGVNSYRYTVHPQELFSPYFGSMVKTLYDWAQKYYP